MKTLTKKLGVANTAQLLRNLSISLACMALVAVTLYILINSPA